MSWFKRITGGILTTTKEKKDTPDGIWHKCTKCSHTSTVKELRTNFYVCKECGHHFRIGSYDYFEIIFDGKFKLLFENLRSKDILGFEDTMSYASRLEKSYKKSDLTSAISVAVGRVGRNPLVIAAMDFSFIGGSMGSVVGEKIVRAIDYCIKKQTPFMIISKSGGARMMESAFSLMQMAKTSAKLAELGRNKIPYFSFLTDPTTGGVTASFAMLGDLNFAEPKALIGFAGPRVIKETIKKELPEGFQYSEFLLDSGFLDFIVHRSELRATINELLILFSTSQRPFKG